MLVARRGANWLSSRKLIYTCPPPLPGSTVTAIANTTHLHHIALATSNGQIHIHNILADLPLFTLGPKFPSSKRITSLSFCTDPAVGAGTSPERKASGNSTTRILAAGDSDGDITLWDLEKRRIVGVMRAAHGNGVVKCEFLAGQKVMITTGGDNSLKVYIFSAHSLPWFIYLLLGYRNGSLIHHIPFYLACYVSVVVTLLLPQPWYSTIRQNHVPYSQPPRTAVYGVSPCGRMLSPSSFLKVPLASLEKPRKQTTERT